MDNLSKDALAAAQAGMTYGKWKVLHPHTKPDSNAVTTKGTDAGLERFEVCVVCRTVFKPGPYHRITCSPECQKIHRREHNRNYMRRYRGQGGLDYVL